MNKIIILLVISILLLFVAEYNSPQDTEYVSLAGAAIMSTIVDVFLVCMALGLAYLVVYIVSLIRIIQTDHIPFPEEFMTAATMLFIAVAAMWFDENKYVMIGMAVTGFFAIVVLQDLLHKSFENSKLFNPKMDR